MLRKGGPAGSSLAFAHAETVSTIEHARGRKAIITAGSPLAHPRSRSGEQFGQLLRCLPGPVGLSLEDARSRSLRLAAL